MNGMELKELFIKNKFKKFIFVQPGGNWGDFLIYFGAEHLANSCGIDFTSYTKEQFLDIDTLPKNDQEYVIYIHGGGAFNEWCSASAFQILQHAVDLQNAIIIYGPCTCGDNVKFLEEKFSKIFNTLTDFQCYFYSRENITFNILNSLNCFPKTVSILFDCDTALHADKEAILDYCDVEERFDYDFFALREDNEQPNFSFSKSYTSVHFDPAIWCRSFKHWLIVHINAKKIITNRTHSSILGAVLKKETHLLDGSYHKNKSIWKDFLIEKGVYWEEESYIKQLLKYSLIDRVIPGFLKKSWKFNYYYLLLQGVPSNKLISKNVSANKPTY